MEETELIKRWHDEVKHRWNIKRLEKNTTDNWPHCDARRQVSGIMSYVILRLLFAFLESWAGVRTLCITILSVRCQHCVVWRAKAQLHFDWIVVSALGRRASFIERRVQWHRKARLRLIRNLVSIEYCRDARRRSESIVSYGVRMLVLASFGLFCRRRDDKRQVRLGEVRLCYSAKKKSWLWTNMRRLASSFRHHLLCHPEAFRIFGILCQCRDNKRRNAQRQVMLCWVRLR
jgi:hypothetical protein